MKDKVLTASRLGNLFKEDAPIVVVDDQQGYVPLAHDVQVIREASTGRVIAYCLRGALSADAFAVQRELLANMKDAGRVAF